MAGNIQNVNFPKMGERVANYIIRVRSIGTNLKDIKQGIFSLRNYWTGKRMNAIIEKYNSVNQSLLTNFNFFGKTVLHVLCEINAQYQQMENQGIAVDLNDQTNAAVDEIGTAIELTSIENVKFEQDNVVSTVSKINGSFEKLTSDLSAIVTILDDLKTDSDSLNKLVTNYNAVADSMVSNINQIKDSLKTEIDNAVKVVQTTESYNDSDASRIQSNGSE